MTDTITRQELTIHGWHPHTNPNARTSHWSSARMRHKIDYETAWASAKQAGWRFVPGKVRLSITFVYRKGPLPDVDNLVARCKGVIDGLKARPAKVPGYVYAGGFFVDDSPEWLDLNVTAVVDKTVADKQLRITLEPFGL